MSSSVIVMSLLGLLFLVFGYFIGVKQMLILVPGFREETFTGNKEKLTKTMGLAYTIIGILSILLPFGLEYIGSITGIIYAAIIVIGVAAMLAVLKRNKES